jgi:LEA14-like dessication related protein
MSVIKPILILSGIGIIAYAIYNYYQKQVSIVKDIQYDITNVQIADYSLEKVSLDITSKIYNASNVSATIKLIYLDVFIDNVRVGNINEVKDIVILPTNGSEVTVRFSFNPQIVLGNIFTFITQGANAKDIKISLQGYVAAEINFIQTTVPFQYDTSFKTIMNKK